MSTTQPRGELFAVTGASGSGKTAALNLLTRMLSQCDVHDFDELGVPEQPDRVWRQRTTEHWLRFALESPRPVVLVGGAVAGEILACPSAAALARIAIAFLDCDDFTRIDRLRQRGSTPNQETLNWAAWLRVHVVDPTWEPAVIQYGAWSEMAWDRLAHLRRGDTSWQVEILDTARCRIEEVAARLASWVQRSALPEPRK